MPYTFGKYPLMANGMLVPMLICFPLFGATIRRGNDTERSMNGVYYGFSGLLFGLSLIDMASTPFPHYPPKAFYYIGAAFIFINVIWLFYAFSGPVKPVSNSDEVPQ